ncbi:MAG: phosphoribosylglycinamide formyltransferase [Granulosicoccus sp.]
MSAETYTAKADCPEIAILISGRGSNMLAIVRACQSGVLPARVSHVVSNTPNAAGLAAAGDLGVRTCVVDHRRFATREDFDLALCDVLSSDTPDWIALAGFMRILGKRFVETWPGKILNIHPSLLPRYPGLNTHARAIAAGDDEAGATVHLVTDELDAGPILAQRRVPIIAGDTPETLAKRVLSIEHSLYIEALQRCVKTAGSMT